MSEEELAAMTAAACEDLVLLMKEYARQGYLATSTSTVAEFEALWRAAFPPTGSAQAQQVTSQPTRLGVTTGG
jgi:hypothetical protein